MKERLEIIKLYRYDPTIIINNSSEFYGACRHKPRFHRYPKNCTPHSTDDKHSSERVNTRASIDSQNSLGTISTDFSPENDSNLCRPCTNVESQHLENSNNLVVIRELIDSQNSLGTTNTELSLENGFKFKYALYQ